jgi:hypothetical protein
VCKSFRSVGLRTVFDYTEPMAFHGITYLLAPARFAAFRGQVEPRSPAAPPRGLGSNTISTKLRAPFA